MPAPSLSRKQKAELKTIFARLSSGKPTKVYAAQTELNHLGEDRLTLLLAFLKEEVRVTHRWLLLSRLFLIGLIPLLLKLLVAWIAGIEIVEFGGSSSVGIERTFPFVIAAFIVGALAVVGNIRAEKTTYKNILRQLATFNDKRIIGPLIDTLGIEEKHYVATVRKQLTSLLPCLQASDAYLLNDRQRTTLYQALHQPQLGPEFPLAILKALEQIGDESAIPHVEKLAKAQGAGGYFPEVLIAAQNCLPFLKQRIEQTRTSQTLLRASSAANALASTPDVLLRPAAFTDETTPQELLRPTGNEEAVSASAPLAQTEAVSAFLILNQDE